MVKSDKDKIKKIFFYILELSNDSNLLKSELQQTMINQAVVQSISIESKILNPIFLFNQHEPEDLRHLERHSPDLFNLMIETNSLRNTYLNVKNTITKKHPPNFEWLIGIHKEIFKRTRYDTAGKLRTNKSVEQISEHPLTHHSIIPEQMRQHFDWLIDRLSQHKKITVGNLFEHIYISAEMHFRLVSSLPFEYGNGIMARFITDYILLSKNIFFPVVDFSSKERYFQAIRNTKVDNYRELTDYFIEIFGENLSKIEGFIELFKIQSNDLDKSSELNHIYRS